MNVNIRLAEERDLENMRLLRNENREAFFSTAEVSPDQQLKWWEGRDKSTLYFVGDIDGRHCWQFSLSADGVLGNLVVADWCKGQGVAKRSVARVLVPGQYYWGLFRTDNPTILRFWPSVVRGLEPSDDPPAGKERTHPRGTVQWVSFTWSDFDAANHQVIPWYVEQAGRLASRHHCNVHFAEKIRARVRHLGFPFEAVAYFFSGAPGGVTEFPGLPKSVVHAIDLLTKKPKETYLDHLLRIKRLQTDDTARVIKCAVLEHLLATVPYSNDTELWRMAWHILERS